MSRKPKETSRQAILDSALRVANAEGLLALTLDNVAREAGVSKGGLIYHFASKDELIRGLLEHFGRKMEMAAMERVALDPAPSGRWVRAMVEISFPREGESVHDNEMQQFFTTLMAAVAVNPSLLAPLLPMAKRLRERILAEGDDGIEQLLTWLILDGVAFWQMCGLIDPKDPLLQRLIEEVRQRVAAKPRIVTSDRKKSSRSEAQS